MSVDKDRSFVVDKSIQIDNGNNSVFLGIDETSNKLILNDNVELESADGAGSTDASLVTRKVINDVIDELSNLRFQFVQFQYIGQMNYDQYLFADTHKRSDDTRRSGDSSNGYRYDNSAPITCAFDGDMEHATASITGIAVSTGSPASSVQLKFELWSVGFTGEGTKLGDIIFNINSSSYTIGTYWNSSIVSAFAEEQIQTPITIDAGTLLALKFIRQTGSDKVVAITNATITLEIVGES